MRSSRQRDERIQRLETYYAANPPTGRDIRYAVIDCMRAGVSDRKAAEMLSLDVDTVRFQRDMAIQDSQ